MSKGEVKASPHNRDGVRDYPERSVNVEERPLEDGDGTHKQRGQLHTKNMFVTAFECRGEFVVASTAVPLFNLPRPSNQTGRVWQSQALRPTATQNEQASLSLQQYLI
jgi:hypothetical protein